MGYYGIFWDNSLGDLINKSQQRKNEENIAIMNIRSTFVHTVNQRIESYGDTFAILRVICPEIGNVH